MSSENEDVVRRFINDCINERQLELLHELFSPDYINHAATSDISNDLDGYKTRLGYMIEGFPDLNIEINDSLSIGDMVVVRLTIRGTQLGIYFNKPASGRQATWTAIAIYRITEGRIVERWENRDDLGLLQQLNISPVWT